MILGVSTGVVAIVAATLVVGATVQGVVGLGLGLVAAPIIALLDPSLMPVLPLVLAVLLAAITLIGEHDDIDWRGLAWALPARIPGTYAGVALLAVFSDRHIGIAVAVMVLIAVAVSLREFTVPVTAASLVTAGFVAGVSGTATSIGGPPIALLYQHHRPRQIRTTLAVFFVVGALLSLAGLAIAGQVELRVLALAGALSPCLLVGVWLASRLRGRVPEAGFRLGVLLVCALSAVVLLLKSLA